VNGLPRFVLGASAYNDHVQQMARALYEANRLACYVTGAVDVWRTSWARGVRQALGQLPGVERQLSRRAIRQVPSDLVRARWGWDLARTAASVAGLDAKTQDWLWERAERALDADTARWLSRADVGGYLGVEFGALASLRAARDLGKPGLVSFLSPHHRARARWVDPDLLRFGGLQSDSDRRLAELSIERDRLRDEEARLADGIITGSTFTTRSLVAAGIPEDRILTVPLGGPAPLDAAALPAEPPAVPRFIYAGSVAIHKGVPHLLEAWSRLAVSHAELHVYGRMQLPLSLVDGYRKRCGDTVVFHGSVPAAELSEAYLHGSALILPTLADGFGQVVADALAHGLPVITTTNAGAADRIVQGECGFVVPPADADALAERLEWCLSHPRDLWRMRGAALDQAHRWTWAHFRAAFIEGVTDLLAGQKAVAVAWTA
jgi:glycosyltransferase involved in cell wall biosynthesis